MMNTLVRIFIGRERLTSMISRTSSTPVRRGGVHFEHVRLTFGQDGEAVVADAARIGGRAAGAVRADAVQRAGDDAGGGRFADAAHAGQHERVRHAADGEGVAQNAHHRLLPDQVVERRRPVFARQHAVSGGVHRRGCCGRQRVAKQARTLRGEAAVVSSAVSSWNRPDMPGWVSGRARGISGRGRE